MANKEILYKNKTHKISYEIFNNNIKESILIIHGWGSNKEIMANCFNKKLNNFRQIYIDLPGFGQSDIVFALNVHDYTQIVKIFLEAIKTNPIAAMGHSFGGKVSTLLELDNLILLSSAGIIEPKALSVKIKIKIFKFLKLFGLGKFYSLFVSNDVKGMNKIVYETFKNVIKEDFIDIFQKYKKNTLIFWGKDDKQTHLCSGEKIHSLIKNSKFFPLDGDHFFFVKHSDFISNTIENEILNKNNLNNTGANE